MPDQEHPVVGIEHDPADAERHAARNPPVEMEHLPQLRLEAFSQFLQCRHNNPGWTDLTFDPYIAT